MDMVLDGLIEVKVFKNGIELKDSSFVEPGTTVEEGEKALNRKFQQTGSLQLGPLVLKASKQLQKETIYSYYFSETGSNQAQPDEDLTQFWEALKAAEIQTLPDRTKLLILSESAFPGESGKNVKKLLVRHCYEELADMMVEHFKADGRVFVLNGNPGIGKSLFSFFLMWRLAKSGGQTIVWECRNADDARVMFSSHGVLAGPLECFKKELRNEKTWYIVDGKPPKRVKARTVLVSSPDHNINKDALKWGAKLWRWMPVWEEDEIKLAGVHIFGQREEEFMPRYDRWLGVPRYVLQLTDDADQDSLDDAIRECTLDILQQSYTSLTTHKSFSHKLIHVQVTPGYFKGPVEIVKGYVEDALLTKFLRARDSKMEHFFETSISSPVLQAFRGKIFEKRFAHNMLEKGGPFRMSSLHIDSIDSSPIMEGLPACSSAQRIANHEDIKSLPNGVYGWPGASNWHFAGIDAVRQPDILYQVTVSERHGINTHGLAAAVKNLRCAPGQAKLIFAVTPDAFSHSHTKQSLKAIRGRADLKAMANSVQQILLELPIRAHAEPDTAEHMEV